MRIQVGQKYRDREGRVVEITSDDSNPHWPMNSADGRCFTRSGRYVGEEDDTTSDLIEVVEQKKTTGDLTLSVEIPTQAMKDFADHCERAAAALERIKDIMA